MAPLALTPFPERTGDDLAAMLRGDSLHFDLDKADLTAESERRLQNVAQILQSHPGLAVRIEGNCDERGTEEFNLQLGEERANAARRYLNDLGVEASRITTLSYGKDRPLDARHNPLAWATNRRDDIKPHSGETPDR